jgi:hypothetical protein
MSEINDLNNQNSNIPKKRGRKPKNNIVELASSIKNNDYYDINEENKKILETINNDKTDNNSEIFPKKRGRKPKIKDLDVEEKIPKKRGRKPKEKVYCIKELPKTFYEENKNETLILHLPINIENKELEPQPLEDPNNFKINENMNNEIQSNDTFNLPTQVNFLEDEFIEKNENINENINESKNQNISQKIEKNKAWEVDQKNCNKIVKKNLRNILYEFMNCNKDKVWPEKTNINCWWCCHGFENTPCSMPYRYKKEKFYVKGVFCSFNCAASHNFSLNDDDVYERYSLLNLMYKKLYYRKFVKINLAPPRESLKFFGGYLSIEEFRENCLNNDRLFNLIDPPLISIIPKIEESMNHNKDFDGVLKFNVNENILQKTQDTLKLKRKKPINNPNNSLQTFMDLKII